MITIRIEKTHGHKWNETGSFALEFPKSELRHRVYDCQLDKDGETPKTHGFASRPNGSVPSMSGSSLTRSPRNPITTSCTKSFRLTPTR